MKKTFILLWICITCLVGKSAAQDASEESQMRYHYRLDSTTIMIGDQTTLAIERAAVYPSLDELTNNDIIAIKQWMDTTDGTLYTTLTSFETGEHWLHIGIDSIMLTVNDVANVDTTTAEIRDIANIMNQPYTFGEIARVLLYLYIFWAIIIAAILIYIRIKRHKPLISLPHAPPLPPDIRALQKLEELRQQQLWQQDLLKEYYTELTDTVRVYLEESYNIPSTEMTTDQTLQAFHLCCGYTEENASSLSQILQAADMVKFAKSKPQPYQHDMALNQSINFVKNTASLNPQPESNTESEDEGTTTNNSKS